MAEIKNNVSSWTKKSVQQLKFILLSSTLLIRKIKGGMYLDKSILMEYEDLLIGNKERISTEFIGYTRLKQENLLCLLQYIIENILRWDSKTTLRYINNAIIDAVKAKKLIGYIDFPPELDKSRDIFYLAKLIYPKEIKYTHKDIVIHVYTEILKKNRTKFPAEFFSDRNGSANLSICLNYYLATHDDLNLSFYDIDEAYEFFSDSKKVNPFLNRAKLYIPCNDMYDSPLDMFHDVLSSNIKNEYLYMKYKFDAEYVKTRRIVRKQLKEQKDKEKEIKK